MYADINSDKTFNLHLPKRQRHGFEYAAIYNVFILHTASTNDFTQSDNVISLPLYAWRTT